MDSFGVGTKLATCDPQPSLGGVYKLSAIREHKDEAWRPVIKLSEMAYKRTIPGIQSIRRYYDMSGCPIGDMIYDEAVLLTQNVETSAVVTDILDPYSTHKLAGTSQELMVRVVADGTRTKEAETIEVARERCHDALMHLDPAYTRFLNPQVYTVGLEQGLAKLRHELAVEHACAVTTTSE